MKLISLRTTRLEPVEKDPGQVLLTGSSEGGTTAYSSPLEVADGKPRLFRGRAMLSIYSGSGTAPLYLLAMTFGTAIGVTSEALPIRRYLEPGWMTTTCEPRLCWLLRVYRRMLARCVVNEYIPLVNRRWRIFDRHLLFSSSISSPKSL